MAGFPRVTHPSATQSQGRHPEGIVTRRFVRLACVKHAASVHPEPGSNSHVDMLLLNEQLRYEFSKTIVLRNLTRQRRSRASSLV